MKEKNNVERTEQVTTLGTVTSSENGMDLADLLNLLVQWKFLVITVASVTFIAIVANAFLNNAEPIYKASAFVSIPTDKNIEGISGYIPAKAFGNFVQNLKARAVRLRYFNENKLIDKLSPDGASGVEEIFEEKFNKMLSVQNQGNQASVSFQGSNAKSTAEWVNGFIMLANKETVRAMIEHENSSWKSALASKYNQLNNLHKSIADRRNAAKREREDQILRLEEAARIAERIGIENVVLTSDYFSYLAPDYIRGAKALRAESSVLRERKSDAPFISELRELQSKLANIQSEIEQLKLTHKDLSHVTSMQVMQMATVPHRPVNKPVFKWIMVTGVLGGLVLGMLAAFFADFLIRAREKAVVQ